MDTSHENIMVAQSNLELSLGLSSCGLETHPGALEQMMLVIKEKEKKPNQTKVVPKTPKPPTNKSKQINKKYQQEAHHDMHLFLRKSNFMSYD